MDSIKLVEEFHKVFGHPIGSTPMMPPHHQMKFRDAFIKEELEEISKAFDDGHRKDGEVLVDLADGLGDIQYVLDGWFLNAGLHHKKDAIMAEIHRSNMTKACKSLLEAEDTITILKRKDEIGAKLEYHSEQHGKYWIVYRSSDRKVMKSINYEPPNLKRIIYGEDL